VAHSHHGIFIPTQKCVLDLLAEIGNIGCKPIEIPIEQLANQLKMQLWIDNLIKGQSRK